ncbi:condensation domain-containing protein [Kitasatospora sp. NBC_00374]|uniref:condensation domain-containing protein n=1 Tax=Kitasatospora sp. NBC_00374 TaxID=2975964 RepID=UPI0030E1663F
MTAEPTPQAGHEVSLGQEALWFLQKLAPASPAYNVAMAVRIRQALDDAALHRAAASVAARHELLRSGFTERDGRPRRVVADALPGLLEIRELPDTTEEQLHAAAREAVARPFDLAEPGPVRLLLLRRSREDVVLLLAAHHAVTDGASQVLVLEDLLTAYRAELDGEDPGRAGVARPYREYVAAERELLDSPRRAVLADHWRAVCEGVPSALELPTDRPRPARKRFTGASWDFRLPEDLARSLRPAAAAAGVTPFVLLFGAFQALLHRWTAQPEFLVGYAVSTRPERTMRSTVGYFVNTLPCRAAFTDGDLTFRRLLERTADQLRQGIAHRDLPLPLLPAELGLAHDPSRTPVFQSMFSLITATRFQPLLELLAPEDGAKPELLHHGVRLTGFDLPQQEGQFDLSAEVLQSDGAVKVAFKYDTDLFDAATVGRMANHYRLLLAAAVADPDLSVRRVPLVDAAERATLLSFATADW